jgi:acyl carrier protein
MLQAVKEILSDTLEIDIESITVDSSQSTIKEWDSLRHLNLIVEIEDKFNVSFEPEEIGEMTSVEKILNYLNLKTNG